MDDENYFDLDLDDFPVDEFVEVSEIDRKYFVRMHHLPMILFPLSSIRQLVLFCEKIQRA